MAVALPATHYDDVRSTPAGLAVPWLIPRHMHLTERQYAALELGADFEKLQRGSMFNLYEMSLRINNYEIPAREGWRIVAFAEAANVLVDLENKRLVVTCARAKLFRHRTMGLDMLDCCVVFPNHPPPPDD